MGFAKSSNALLKNGNLGCVHTGKLGSLLKFSPRARGRIYKCVADLYILVRKRMML